MDFKSYRMEDVDCIHQAQDGVQCAFVNTIINPRIPKSKEVYFLSEWLLTPKEGFCSVELVIPSDHMHVMALCWGTIYRISRLGPPRIF
jgi:hypothetical protein